METANKDNVAETPFPQNSNPRTGPKTIESVARELVAAIIAKVQADIEPADHSVHELVTETMEHPDFEHRVSELAYGQAEDFFCDTDISDKVEECLEYRDWEDTVGSFVDTSVEQALSESEFADKDSLADLETQVEERMGRVESLLANLPCDLNDLAESEPRVSDLEHFERRTMERLEDAELRFKAIEERLTELEQVTSSKFGQLDNIQIAFRGIVETMFAR